MNPLLGDLRSSAWREVFLTRCLITLTRVLTILPRCSAGIRLNQLVEVRLSAVRASPSPLVPRHITRVRHCHIDVVPSSVIGAHKHNLLTASGPSQPADSGDFSLMVLGTSRISQ
jgi:hypothetical protein